MDYPVQYAASLYSNRTSQQLALDQRSHVSHKCWNAKHLRMHLPIFLMLFRVNLDIPVIPSTVDYMK